MNLFSKSIDFLVDLIWRPQPSCKEKPLDKVKMIGVIVGFLAIILLLILS